MAKIKFKKFESNSVQVPLIMKKEQKAQMTSMGMPSKSFCIQNVRCLLIYMYKSWQKTQRYQLILTEYLFGFGGVFWVCVCVCLL